MPASPQNSQESTIPNFPTTLTWAYHYPLASFFLNLLKKKTVNVRGNWQIECSCEIIVNFVVSLVLLIPLTHILHSGIYLYFFFFKLILAFFINLICAYTCPFD